MSQSARDSLEKKLTDNLSRSNGGKAKFIDPATITAILGVVLQLVQGCFNKGTATAESVVEQAKSGSRRAVRLTERAVRKQMPNAGKKERAAYVDAVLKTGGEATPEEIKQATEEETVDTEIIDDIDFSPID